MGGVEINLKEYEDPAPKNLGLGVGDRERAEPRLDLPVTKKRKLPFRANIPVKSPKYKGKRASRSDVELDAATLGLLQDADGSDGISDASVDSDIAVYKRNIRGKGPDNDASLDEVGSESLDESDIHDEASDGNFERRARRRQQELQEDERAEVERLARAEEEDIRRALAVQKQRDLYDSIVNLRIKLEPLMSIARTFPNVEQRKESSEWKESEELKKEMSSAESALASLCAQAEKVFMLSWQADDGGGTTEEDSKNFAEWRNSILDEWGRKVNEAEGVVPKGGFKTIDTSVSAQMKASLASGKHLARTRRVRERIDLVGGLELAQGYHDIQYDDAELYRTLLRDIIESGDATGGGLRYAQLSKGGRVKKKRDTSLAKGKRLKYDVHEKLVGFLTPMPMPDPGPVDEIIASLFGRTGTTRKDQGT